MERDVDAALCEPSFDSTPIADGVPLLRQGKPMRRPQLWSPVRYLRISVRLDVISDCRKQATR